MNCCAAGDFVPPRCPTTCTPGARLGAGLEARVSRRVGDFRMGPCRRSHWVVLCPQGRAPHLLSSSLTLDTTLRKQGSPSPRGLFRLRLRSSLLHLLGHERFFPSIPHVLERLFTDMDWVIRRRWSQVENLIRELRKGELGWGEEASGCCSSDCV